MAKKLYITVINDLSGDQRMHRIATSLMDLGFEVHLIGRRLPDSIELNRPYHCHRMRLLFNKGKFFYLEYNLRLFLYLFFRKVDILNSCDLDTLLAGFLLSKLKRIKLVYDSHEYFTEVPELQHRAATRNIWLRLERWIFPKLKHVYTVNDSLAKVYSDLYEVEVHSIRNLPFSKAENQLGSKENIFIYQGALNLGRGIELMIQSMTLLEEFQLWIVGKGDIEGDLKQLVGELKLGQQVFFKGFIPLEKLHELTSQAILGFSLEENMGKNYYYASPNKVFDYIQAGIPVIASDLPEMRKIIENHQVGEVLKESDRNSEKLAQLIRQILELEKQNQSYSKSSKLAAKSLNWESEEKKLKKFYQKLLD
ncbi:MAG: glycosyltransferase [Bacteroidia bacterium]|nr:glycosyltransferase [Bacteroidia bacterium]